MAARTSDSSQRENSRSRSWTRAARQCTRRFAGEQGERTGCLNSSRRLRRHRVRGEPDENCRGSRESVRAHRDKCRRGGIACVIFSGHDAAATAVALTLRIFEGIRAELILHRRAASTISKGFHRVPTLVFCRRRAGGVRADSPPLCQTVFAAEARRSQHGLAGVRALSQRRDALITMR
jgi:hypothetical protein